jgi:hypothetical protein
MEGGMRIQGTPAVLTVLLVASTALTSQAQPASADLTPGLKCVATEQCFCVRPAFEPAIKTTIDSLRNQIATAHAAGKSVGYLSVPMSGSAGANFELNQSVAADIKTAVEGRFGNGDVFLINPAATTLPDLPTGQKASQGEYLFLWAQTIAGQDGFGRDLDFVYFAGPSDFAAALHVSDPDRLGHLRAFFDGRRRTDAKFDKWVTDNNVTPVQFARYYGLGASASFSRGCHDEWNIVSTVNRRRVHLAGDFGIQRQLPVWFDGRQVGPAEMTAEVAEGNSTNSCSR